MNKKFSTLLMVLVALFTVSTVSAQLVKTSGAYTFLMSAGKYMSIDPTKTDSVIAVTLDLNNDSKTTIDYAMWKIDEDGFETGSGNVTYKITNKKTGAVLQFEAKEYSATTGAPSENIKAGVAKWANGANNTIYAYFATGKKLALSIVGDDFIVDANGTAFTQGLNGLTARSLKANELGDGFTVFGLSFGEAYSENIFNGKQLVATDITAPAGQAGNWVSVQEVGKETLKNKALYFGLDTSRYVIGGQQKAHGSKFVQDTTYVAGTPAGVHTVGNAALQKFQFIMDLSTDKISMSVADAYNFDTKALLGDAVKVVYAQVLTSKVLTVSQADPAQGTAPVITLSKGTPTTIPTGTGVYFMKAKDPSDNKVKYVYGNSLGGISYSATAPIANQPAGQWYIVEKDSKYMAVEREYNVGQTTPIEIYAVEGSADTYKFLIGGQPYVATLEYQRDITAGGKAYHYLATKYLTPAEMANYAFTLNLISGTSGVDHLYTFLDAKSNLIIKAQTTAADASKFKAIEVYNDKVWQDATFDHSKGVGAIALGDTLAVTSYQLYQQYTNNYVTVGADGNLIVKENNALTFTFEATAKANQYLLTGGGVIYVLDVNTGKLIPGMVSNPNYFDLVQEAAPNYANVNAPGHKNVKSAEDDAKMLSMNSTSLFAEIKRAGQVVTKADSLYTDSMFGIFIDTAYMKDAGKPMYYITTQNGLNATEKATGVKYYLLNTAAMPYYYDYLYDAATTAAAKDAIQKEKNAFDAMYYDAANYEYKAAFFKGQEFGDDSLKIFKTDKFSEFVFKNMSSNPAAISFATTADGTYLVEAKAVTDYSNNFWRFNYLSVINNVVYWATWIGAHEFTVTPTSVFPTSNVTPEAGFQVYATEGGVIIKNAANSVVTIVNVLGQTVAKTTITSDYATVAAPAGVVFVTINGETVKALVK